jgi:hypothetical protein
VVGVLGLVRQIMKEEYYAVPLALSLCKKIYFDTKSIDCIPNTLSIIHTINSSIRFLLLHMHHVAQETSEGRFRFIANPKLN